MVICSSCGKETSATSEYCRHCGSSLVKSKRPLLLIISSILFLGLFSVVELNSFMVTSLDPNISYSTNSFFWGIRVPFNFILIVHISELIVSIYCGVGIFFLKKVAKYTGIGFIIYRIGDLVLSSIAIVFDHYMPFFYLVYIVLLPILIYTFLFYSLFKYRAKFV